MLLVGQVNTHTHKSFLRAPSSPPFESTNCAKGKHVSTTHRSRYATKGFDGRTSDKSRDDKYFSREIASSSKKRQGRGKKISRSAKRLLKLNRGQSRPGPPTGHPSLHLQNICHFYSPPPSFFLVLSSHKSGLLCLMEFVSAASGPPLDHSSPQVCKDTIRRTNLIHIL